MNKRNRTLSVVGDSPVLTCKKEKKLKLASPPAPTAEEHELTNDKVDLSMHTKDKIVNDLETKREEILIETPGNLKIVGNQSSPKLVAPNYMTPDGTTFSISHSVPTNWLPSHDAPRWAHPLIDFLKDLRIDIASLKKEMLEIKRISTSTQPGNAKTTSSSAKPSLPISQQLQSNQPNSMDIDSPEPNLSDSADQVIPPHASFLHECFKRRIGISPHHRSHTTITSFDGEYIATGFNKILPTYQGYYVELDHSDILWANLEKLDTPDFGEESWHSPGLIVFRRTRKDTRTSPQAHRFALKPCPELVHPCNPLRLDKWYIHAYQVRFIVKNQYRSLNSRRMSTRLNALFPNYHPRGKDRSWSFEPPQQVDNTIAHEQNRLHAPNSNPNPQAEIHEVAKAPLNKTNPIQQHQPAVPQAPFSYSSPSKPNQYYQAPIPQQTQFSNTNYLQMSPYGQTIAPKYSPHWQYQPQPFQPAHQYSHHGLNPTVPQWQYQPHTFQPAHQLANYGVNPGNNRLTYARTQPDRPTFRN